MDPEMQSSQVPFFLLIILPYCDLLLKKVMATHSSILAWRISWTEEPGRLQSMGSQSQMQMNTHTWFITGC